MMRIPSTAHGGSSEPDGDVQSSGEALEQDLALVADGQGWTMAEASAYYRSAEIIGALAERIYNERRDVYVGSAVSTEPEGPPTLYIKGPADDFIHRLVADAEIEIVLADGQPFSFDELEQRNQRVHEALKALGFRDIASGFDITARGHIHAGVTAIAGLPDDPRLLTELIADDLRDDVTVSISEKDLVTDFDAFGGYWVRVSGTNACTSGWSVRNAAGTTGVTTAAHCSGINEINHAGHGVHSLSFVAQHNGAWGDVEWHTSTQAEPARFVADETGVIRNVTAVEHIANLAVNEFVCQFGRSSFQRDCNLRVQVVSQTCTNSGVTTNRLVMMNGLTGAPGDSGGGWSFDNRAYGSEKGRCAPNFVNNEVWSAAHYYPNALGVSVRTQ